MGKKHLCLCGASLQNVVQGSHVELRHQRDCAHWQPHLFALCAAEAASGLLCPAPWGSGHRNPVLAHLHGR